MQNVPVSRQGGLTLVELVVVIGLLAVIAAIAVPSLTSSDSKRLDVAAAEFAAAIRFARAESLRTAKPHGFRFLASEDRIRVFRVDTQVAPWASVFDVYDPVNKNLYDVTFPTDLAGSVTPVTQTAVYRGACNSQGEVYFDASGTPWCLDPQTVLVSSYRLDLLAGIASTAIVLDGITGRVSIQ